MTIRCEYWLVCDECSVYLGEDQGDEDYLTDTTEVLIEEALHRGWSFVEDEGYCAECTKARHEEEVPAL